LRENVFAVKCCDKMTYCYAIVKLTNAYRPLLAYGTKHFLITDIIQMMHGSECDIHHI